MKKVFKKITAAAMTAVLCLASVAAASAAGTGELSISTSSTGSYELQINLTNTSASYLANVEMKVAGANADRVKVDDFGITGTGGERAMRAIAPGETVPVYAKLSYTGNSRPSGTVTSSAQAGGQYKPSQDGNIQAVQTSGGNSPSQNYPVSNASNASDVTVNVSADSVSGEVASLSGTDGEAKTDTEGTEKTGTDGSTVHTIHSMTPGESTTLYASLAGGSEDEPVKVIPSDEIPSYTIWIGLGVVVVLVNTAIIVKTVKKKKKADNSKDSDDSDNHDKPDGKGGSGVTKTIVSMLAVSLLLSAFVSGDALTANAAAGTAGHAEETVTVNGVSIVISVDYTVVPAPVTEPLKSSRSPAADDECNIPQVDERRLKENAGPMTDHGIYIGKNDFMFYGAAIDDYKGQTILGDLRLKKIAEMMSDRDSWAKQNGIKLYLVIAPNKTSVYPEYVPEKVTPAQKTNADTVVEYLAQNSSVEVIDLRAPLIAAKAEYGDTLFYKYDTHWNNNGGFVAYQEIMRRINEDVPGAYTLKKSDFEITQYETYMKDMAYYLGYYSKYTDYGPVYTLKSGMTATIGDKQNNGFHGQFRFCARWKDGYSDSLNYIEYENTYNKSAPSIFVYRDSFTVSLVHFLKDSFHNSVFDWSYDFSKQEILDSGADIVIMEVVEKQLYEFTNSRTFS